MMSFLQLVIAFFIAIAVSSCGQDYNSNYNDRGTYADIGIPPGTPLYNSYIILQNKCFSCHASPYKDFTSNQAWIDSGRVIAGNFDNSPIKLRLKNFGSNMPPEPNARLTDAEIETLRNWINGL